jgi:hypothetical protein
MADINRFSERLIDVSERFADVVDGAQGRGPRKSGVGLRWLILPAAGAAAYGLATSTSSLARQTRGLMRRATDRATDLPDADLVDRVKEVTGLGEQQGSSTNSRSKGQNRRRRTSQTQRRRKTTTSR